MMRTFIELGGIAGACLEAKGFARREVLARTQAAYGGDDLLSGSEACEESFIVGLSRALLSVHDALAIGALGEVLPQLFGDEGMKGWRIRRISSKKSSASRQVVSSMGEP